MLKKIIVFISLSFLLVGNAISSGHYAGTIEQVWVNDSSNEDVGWIKPASAMNTPACSNTGWFVLDLTKESRKMALTFALSAQATSKEVILFGEGTCFNSSYEYLRGIAIK